MRPPASDGMLAEPEQLLHPQRDRRPALGLVIDRRLRSRRRLEMGRRFVVEAPRQVPGQHRVERVCEIVGADLVELRLADEERREPAGIGGEAPRPTGPATPRPRRGAGTSPGPAAA